MFQTKFVEKIKTHVLCYNDIFFSENRFVYEKMWKDMVQPDRPQITIRRTLHVGLLRLQTHTKEM